MNWQLDLEKKCLRVTNIWLIMWSCEFLMEWYSTCKIKQLLTIFFKSTVFLCVKCFWGKISKWTNFHQMQVKYQASFKRQFKLDNLESIIRVQCRVNQQQVVYLFKHWIKEKLQVRRSWSISVLNTLHFNIIVVKLL